MDGFQVELESTVEHPFFVYGRGWASCKPERTLARYGLRVQRLQVGDVCVSLVARKHAPAHPAHPAHPASAPPQTHPENLSVKEDARKRRWSTSDVLEDDRPPSKKRWTSTIVAIWMCCVSFDLISRSFRFFPFGWNVSWPASWLAKERLDDCYYYGIATL